MQLVPLYSSGVALLRELFEYGGVEVSEWVNLGEDEDVDAQLVALHRQDAQSDRGIGAAAGGGR